MPNCTKDVSDANDANDVNDVSDANDANDVNDANAGRRYLSSSTTETSSGATSCHGDTLKCQKAAIILTKTFTTFLFLFFSVCFVLFSGSKKSLKNHFFK